jgi:hypothetical protein
LGDYLGRDVNLDDGALICVDAACEIVRDTTGCLFNAATDTVTLDGTGTDALLLPETPVSAAGTVTVNGGTLGTADYSLGENGALIANVGTVAFGWDWGWNPYPWPPYGFGLTAGAAVWPKGRNNITVTYDHGYADADIPRSVRFVALGIAARMLVQGVAKSENLGDRSIVYATAATDLTMGERNILRKYKQAR